ncbi:alpha/beta fold hydrolase [Lachnospiraceae bacterium]|nr:alpha/beta fold hydrolase [Lachnospiraceae bacterium]
MKRFINRCRKTQKYLLGYLGKDKITLLGHSWGTYFGCNLVLEYPDGL